MSETNEDRLARALLGIAEVGFSAEDIWSYNKPCWCRGLPKEERCDHYKVCRNARWAIWNWLERSKL